MRDLQVHAESLQQYSIMVATPMYGGQCTAAYAQSMFHLSALCAKHNITLHFYHLSNESLIQRARNYCVETFLNSSCTHLMFIDSDIGFHPYNVLKLLAIQTYDLTKGQYDVVAAPYTTKTIAWEKVTAAVNKGFAEADPNQLAAFGGEFAINLLPDTKEYRLDTPLEVLETGTGFMLIPRYVLERVIEANPEKSYKPDHPRMAGFGGEKMISAVFDCGIDPQSKRFLSEDYYFCRLVRAASMKIHICPWMELHHVGSYVYRGTIAAAAVADQPLTGIGDPSKSKTSKQTKFRKVKSKLNR